VVSHLHPATRTGHPDKGAIWLKVNGATRQSSDLAKMIWSVGEQVSHLSRYYELFPGDIIYCGTPENVGPVVAGDVMQGHIDGLYDINVKVV
jgi:fumarylpyruvate hydrolase